MSNLSTHKYAWVILSILFISQATLATGVYAWGALGPFMKQALSLTNVQFGSITSSLYLTAVLCSIPAGIAVDHWGVKLNLFICTILMGVALILASFMTTITGVLIFVALIGVSYGMINPIASKSLTIWFNAKNRATAFGIRQMGVTVGGAVAGSLLIYLAQLKSWNFAILVVGITAILISFIGVIFYKEPQDKIPTANTTTNHAKASTLDLLKNRNLLLSCLIMALLCLGQNSIASFLVIYLKEQIGLTAITAGSFLTITMICGGAARVFWGVLSDRAFNSRRLPVMKIICTIACISALITFLYGQDLPIQLLAPIVAMFGISYLGFQGLAVVLLVEVCGPELAGRATGLGLTIAWMGMIIGPVLFGTIAEQSYNYAWLLVTFTSLLAILLCYTIKE